jgi:signal transduction histidine kinase
MMKIWLLALVGIMAFIIIALLIKIYLMRKSAKEINEAFADRLVTDTNTLIDISSHDKYMRLLAVSINEQLQKLREERHRFKQGDAEIKDAVTNISHDLRTPLTAIYGYLDLLEKEEKSDNVNRYIAIISDRIDNLKQLTEELFKYSALISTKEDMKIEKVAVNDVLEESIAAFYATLKGRNITPTISMPDTKVYCNLDRQALSRVFSNLLNNAIKYSDGDLDIVLTSNGEITFSNTATRLDELQVEKLFDRFYTVETARKSTGLGLSIARTLVEQMGGEITAKYENGRLKINIFL